MRAWLIVFLVGIASCGGQPRSSAMPIPPLPSPQKSSTPQRTSTKPLVVLPTPPTPPQRTPSSELEYTNTNFTQNSNTGAPNLSLVEVNFSQLSGWNSDQQADALPAFLKSCQKLAALPDSQPIGTARHGGRAHQWRRACRIAATVPAGNHRKARQFFQREFKVYSARGDAGAVGRITGYYVQPLRASRRRSTRYAFPLYKRPPTLVGVSLSDFIHDGRSRRIWGVLDSQANTLRPFPKRAKFRSQTHAPDVLMWLDTPRDVLRVEIEGSGRATMEDGTIVMVAFAGKNGRKSHAIKRVSRQLKAFEVAHQGDRWSAADLRTYHRIMDQKTSVVFFETESRDGAIGTQNIVLTPQRSLAVDRAVIALSTPVWVTTRAPSAPGGRVKGFRKLLISQDTGGAIRGPIRGDIYWGDDADAVAVGKRVNGPGKMWLLLPKTISVSVP